MKIKKPLTNGEILLKKRGKKYFKELADKKWAKFRKEKKEWEAQEKKRKAKKK